MCILSLRFALRFSVIASFSFRFGLGRTEFRRVMPCHMPSVHLGILCKLFSFPRGFYGLFNLGLYGGPIEHSLGFLQLQLL